MSEPADESLQRSCSPSVDELIAELPSSDLAAPDLAAPDLAPVEPVESVEQPSAAATTAAPSERRAAKRLRLFVNGDPRIVGEVPRPRLGHSATVVDSRVVCFGGYFEDSSKPCDDLVVFEM